MAKRALLVGINKYQVPGADLRGCVNDVKDLSEALIKFYGFKKKRHKVLLDTAATQKAMQTGITALLRGAKKETSLCSITKTLKPIDYTVKHKIPIQSDIMIFFGRAHLDRSCVRPRWRQAAHSPLKGTIRSSCFPVIIPMDSGPAFELPRFFCSPIRRATRTPLLPSNYTCHSGSSA